MPERFGFIEWVRAWKAPAKDDYGTWAAVSSVLAAVGVGLWFLDGIVLAIGILCVLAALYVFLGIFFGLPLPPTRAGWETHKLERLREFLLLRDGLREITVELTSARGQLAMELGQRRYSGNLIRQDKWAQWRTNVQNEPIFADVNEVIAAAYDAIETQSRRGYEAHSGGHPRIPRGEANDLEQALAAVDAARNAATAKLSELGIERGQQ